MTSALGSNPALPNDMIDWRQVTRLLDAAREEDLGPGRCDVTSETCIPPTQQATAMLNARADGCAAGLVLLESIGRAYDQSITIQAPLKDGDRFTAGQTLASFHGPLRSILQMERVTLNFLTHLCGVATLTATYVDAVANTKAHILETRKTLPGWRSLQKYAVRCGGGTPHRVGLYDAMLIKDNHLAHIQADSLAEAVTQASSAAREQFPQLKFVEVEVDTLEQLQQVLTCPVDIVLLDNMPSDTLRQAVAMRDEQAPAIQLEASGGVSLQTVQAIAQTGVDRISVGALTHSPPALDLGLDIEESQA